MVVAGVLAIVFYILLAISLVAGFAISARNGDDDFVFVGFIAAWFCGLLGTTSIIAFVIMAVTQVVS